MRVLITKFPHNSLLGGGEFHTLKLVEKLTPRGFSFWLLSSDPVLLREFAKKNYAARKIWAPLEPVSIKGVLLFPFFAPFFFFYLAFYLIKFGLKQKEKVLFCLSYTEKVLMTPLAKLLGYHVVWMEHLRVERSYKANPLRFFYCLFSNLATVVTASKAVGEQLVDLGVKRSRVKVIYNGIDTNFFSPRPKNVASKEVIVGAASRLCSEKAVDDLIKAFAKAVKIVPNLRLKIAGEGPEKEKLEHMIKDFQLTSQVICLGYVNLSDMPKFLASLDIFAQVSRAKESFGLAAASASAMELPLVVTNISGLNEVAADKVTGLVVPIGDIEQISAAMVKLAQSSELREKMGQAGRERVKWMFGEERMIEEYSQLFRDFGRVQDLNRKTQSNNAKSKTLKI